MNQNKKEGNIVKLSASQIKALAIVKQHGPLMPREFAQFMWPDSDGWKTSTKCGNYGATRGGGMNLAGGAYLGKLQKLGLVWNYRREGYRLTQTGKDTLIEAKRKE